MHVGQLYSHFVTEYGLSDNSGEHVKLTEVDYEKDFGSVVNLNHLCIALREWHQL